MKNIQWLKNRTSRLATHIAILVTLAGMLVLVALGFYFDQFLKTRFLQDTENRMQHAFHRLAFNIENIEANLQNGIGFILNHQPTLASIDLINNYEDKQRYNTFLIDEEKKVIAEELLKQVKLSFNDSISLYNQHHELVAYIARDSQGYHLNIISYIDGQPQLLRRKENQTKYTSVPIKLLEQDAISFIHRFFYPTEAAERHALVTYQKHNQGLEIRSHLSLQQTDQKNNIHIEMSRILDADFFSQLSENLNVSLQLSDTSSDTHKLTGLLFPDNGTQQLDIKLSSVRDATLDQTYRSTLKIDTLNGPVFFTIDLARGPLTKILKENQQRFILIMFLAATLSLLFIYFVIHRRLERPLKALMNQINRIEQQDYNQTEQLNSGDELEAVSYKLNHLAESVQERESALERSKAKLEYLSNHDVLTNLPNRRFFTYRLEYALNIAHIEQQKLAIMFIDLDQFKQVNDTLGHHVGDQLLTQVAARLSRNVGTKDTLARIGGDEFNILIEDFSNTQELEFTAEKYLQLFVEPFNVANQEITISSSIGIALFPSDGDDSIDLIKNSDLAMYKAKEQGRNNFCFFSNDLSEEMNEKTEMTHELRQAIQQGNQFVLHYQPKICTQTEQIISIEALIRWISPKYGFVSPDKFIPLAEELGLINPIGQWVLEQGCHDFTKLIKQGIVLEHIGINVSNVQLANESFIPVLLETIQQTGIQPEQLELEITESYIAKDANSAIRTLQSFRDMGLGLAIDDFGTGYSSMSYLQKLPISRLKIDKSFVDGLPHEDDSIAIVNAILSLTRSFNLSVTAEGVENKEQLECLTRMGCDEIQGYYYSKPLPFEQLIDYCSRINEERL